MQLNKFTDYALRILMYVAQPRDDLYTISELAARLQVSENHTMKIVHFMSKEGWLITTRGKGGGIRLHSNTLDLRLGQIVRILQGNNQVVECNTPPCVLRQNCGLKGILEQALEAFYRNLDQYKFSDVIHTPKQQQSLNSTISFLSL
jgi:Rrf2 family transcriptional regulator, nitric oxide-sensitive transcriptional repressor